MSPFTHSTIPVNANAVKSVLFRLAALALQFAIYKLFSWLAATQHAYTAFLMFAEDPIQKAFFVARTLRSRKGLTVLAFALLFGAAALYDTALWALDKPGYIQRAKLVRVSTITGSMVDEPSYVVFAQGKPGAHLNLDEVFAAGLFKPGVNYTLTDKIDRGTAQTVKATVPFEEAGARIWLDDAGFSVGIDQSMMISGNLSCPEVIVSEKSRRWRCEFSDSYALDFARADQGRPEIFWEAGVDSQYLRASRKDNPWASLGQGGDTALMKQFITVTKGKRRHAFLHTVVKTVMLSLDNVPFVDAEVGDLALRFLGEENNVGKDIAMAVESAQANNRSLSIGAYVMTDTTVVATSIELLRPLNTFDGSIVYSMLRFMSANITLIRSDTLANPVVPAEPCDKLFNNEATAGRVRGTNCNKAVHNAPNPHFLGQTDVSTVFILTGVLGDGSSSVSAIALNQAGVDWMLASARRLETLMLARGFILGVDPATVVIALKTSVAAVSSLQICLVLLPVALMLLCWLLVIKRTTAHYQSSLLATLTATTHSSEPHAGAGGPLATLACRKPGYLRASPDIQLLSEEDHVVLGTPRGVFRHDTNTASPVTGYTSALDQKHGDVVVRQHEPAEVGEDTIRPADGRVLYPAMPQGHQYPPHYMQVPNPAYAMH